MQLAQAGQTLLTRAARDALEADGGGGLPLHAHGHWQVKGLAEPLELFAVGSGDAVTLAPADGTCRSRTPRSSGARARSAR
jgi:class 3 adenylate cyclase